MQPVTAGAHICSSQADAHEKGKSLSNALEHALQPSPPLFHPGSDLGWRWWMEIVNALYPQQTEANNKNHPDHQGSDLY